MLTDINPSDMDMMFEENHVENSIVSGFIIDITEKDIMQIAKGIKQDIINELQYSEESIENGSSEYDMLVEELCHRETIKLKPLDIWQIVSIARFSSNLSPILKSVQEDFFNNIKEEYDSSLDLLLEHIVKLMLIKLV